MMLLDFKELEEKLSTVILAHRKLYNDYAKFKELNRLARVGFDVEKEKEETAKRIAELKSLDNSDSCHKETSRHD